MDRLIARISAVSQLGDLNDTFPVVDNDDVKEDDQRPSAAVHQHTTLKLSFPTRWNSSLVMIESLHG